VSRYLVTGCAGFIGSTLTDALLTDAAQVVGVDSFTDYYPRAAKEAAVAAAMEHPEFQLVEHDLGAGDLPASTLDGLDGIFHLAARPGVRSSWGSGFPAYLNDNLMATHAIVEAAVQRDVRMVFASSSSIYGDALAYPTSEDTEPAPISPYGVTKLACEHLIAAYGRDFGLDCVVLRYFTVYGPRQRPDMAFRRIVEALANGDEFEVYGDGRQSRDFTYVDNAIDANMAALTAPGAGGRAYNVACGEGITINRLISELRRELGVTTQAMHAQPRTGDVRHSRADIALAHDHLGYTPRIGLVEGLRRTVGWTIAESPAPPVMAA
jgi:UDP-glucuronate 4-epimerase